MSARVPVPFTLVAELTHRCPLRCRYCSNPTALSVRELAGDTWCRVLREASALGVLQVHFTGGEPLLRPDLEPLVACARGLGLYTSLVTSGVPLEHQRMALLAAAGLEHVQLSFQGATADASIAFAERDVFAQKLRAAASARELGLALTVNFVLHRGNIDEVSAMIELGVTLGADRIELANAQYLGWAFENRWRLLPSPQQIEAARATVRAARLSFPELELDFVLPDYAAGRPRACMDGWAQRYVVVAPDGRVLPCHAASAISELHFDSVADASLATIWSFSLALQRFREVSALPAQCQRCPEVTRDHGGCRCQAYLLTGSLAAVDPACERSPHHELVRAPPNPGAELVPLRARRWRRVAGEN
jgi:pyrroloquinoline quinone biosynthesis protein E